MATHHLDIPGRTPHFSGYGNGKELDRSAVDPSDPGVLRVIWRREVRSEGLWVSLSELGCPLSGGGGREEPAIEEAVANEEGRVRAW